MTKKPKARKPRSRRPKQGILPGAEVGLPPSHPEIDQQANHYVDLRDERMLLLKAEIEAKDKLATLMKSHDLKEYRYDSKLVSLKPTYEKISVKRIPQANGEPEVDDE